MRDGGCLQAIGKTIEVLAEGSSGMARAFFEVEGFGQHAGGPVAPRTMIVTSTLRAGPLLPNASELVRRYFGGRQNLADLNGNCENSTLDEGDGYDAS